VHVDARGEPLVDERARETIGTVGIGGGERGHHDHKIAHDCLLYFSIELL
jgi:uncharacterized protein GlcG (DUF336 family)